MFLQVLICRFDSGRNAPLSMSSLIKAFMTQNPVQLNWCVCLHHSTNISAVHATWVVQKTSKFSQMCQCSHMHCETFQLTHWVPPFQKTRHSAHTAWLQKLKNNHVSKTNVQPYKKHTYFRNYFSLGWEFWSKHMNISATWSAKTFPQG